MSLTDQPEDAQVPDAGSTPDDSDVLADEADNMNGAPDPELATWIMEKVVRWRLSRNNNFGDRWEKYYRIWRGMWDPSLKGKTAERSRIITPATQSAVDQTVAEMAEAVFGRGLWFDLSDESDNEQLQAAEEQIRDNLIDDFEKSRIKSDVIEAFYNGAWSGTGIAKRVQRTTIDGKKYICWDPVPPHAFVIDTAAKTIDDALGVAHETIRPKHEIKAMQKSGDYFAGDVGEAATGEGSTELMKGGLTDFFEIDPQDGIFITEWHGKVPTALLKLKKTEEQKDDIDLFVDEETEGEGDYDETDLTEAVVIIANGQHVLRAEENQLNDRGFVAYQHHRSPDSFFGIGVVEKAFNAQAGLDGEVRARQDALALTSYPNLGIDATRMPRNLNTIVGPGKVYLTNGRPSEIIEAIKFGDLNAATFQQSGDMERYVQLATGATDPAKPVNANSTASGMSQQTSAYIKRAKLTMQSVDEFLSALVRKSIIAYNALDEQRYPKLPDFTVNASMSIMAREFEQMQMTNLLAIIPQESQAFPIILKGIIENYSGPSKDKIIAAIEQMMQPDPKQQQFQAAMQQAQLEAAQGSAKKVQAEVQEILTRGGLNQAKAKTETQRAQMAPLQLQVQQFQAKTAAQTADTQARQLEIDAAKAQIDHHHRTLEHVHKKVANAIALQKANQAPQPA